jgi:hypothetical protein
VLGKNIREKYFEHHEIYYPFINLESKDEYRVKGLLNGDVWHWFIPILSIVYIISYIYYNKHLFNKKTYIVLIITVFLVMYINSYLSDSYHISNHWLNKYEWYVNNKRLHRGISNYIMDKLFGTFIESCDLSKKEENLFIIIFIHYMQKVEKI